MVFACKTEEAREEPLSAPQLHLLCDSRREGQSHPSAPPCVVPRLSASLELV